MPAAAVIRQEQALFGMIGRKEFVDCEIICILKLDCINYLYLQQISLEYKIG